ncbi:MAG: hypothetical protein DI536_33975 [Archangium gephyra]|uniref:FHA domain-containing protein n=1 Tax=Archangium gephyra TaxID=48 RepID=A0A2W5UMV5_9BACT|nr:MAG: hypothetical protein DI536_33975 [Archangium gephyra]
MSTVTIAPHLQRALETMSKDMAVEPQALVNQAVFAWLRINGYVTPGTAVVAPQAVAAAAPPPRVEPVASTPTPAPVEEVAQAFAHTPVEAAPQVFAAAVATPLREPEPVLAPEPTPEPELEAAPEPVARLSAPLPDPEAEKPAPPARDEKAVADVRARMTAIEQDLAKLARPWRAWAGASDEEEQQDEGASTPEDEALDDALAAAADEAIDTDRHAPSREEEPEPPEEPTGTGGRSLVDEEPMDGNTGETELEEPHESTVVFSSSSIALFLERDGQEPVQVTVERFVIGRGPQCDLIIDSPRVSREHAALTREGVTWVLEDLNSSNGTWLGEDRVTRREIESGDVINLGNEPITFVLRAS